MPKLKGNAAAIAVARQLLQDVSGDPVATQEAALGIADVLGCDSSELPDALAEPEN